MTNKPRFELKKYEEAMYTYWTIFDTLDKIDRCVFTERTKAVKVLQAANNGNYQVFDKV